MNVFDNALSPQLFNYIKSQIFDYKFPWYYCDTSNKISAESIYGNSFSHLVLDNNKVNSLIAADCKAALYTLADKIGLEIDYISRIRAGLLQPKPNGLYTNTPHVDNEYLEHYVGLLYLNDSDGETFLYNERYDPQSGLTESEYYDIILRRKVTVKEVIECKENRFVCFDGYTYHSSTCPMNVNRRITVNFNFVVKKEK
jgi:hypothetical protein